MQLPENALADLMGLGLDDSAYERILYKNGAELLGLKGDFLND